MNQIKQMPTSEQTQVMGDRVNCADAPICHTYAAFGKNVKLGFWYQLRVCQLKRYSGSHRDRDWSRCPPGRGRMLAMVSKAKTLAMCSTRVEDGSIWVEL